MNIYVTGPSGVLHKNLERSVSRASRSLVITNSIYVVHSMLMTEYTLGHISLFILHPFYKYLFHKSLLNLSDEDKINFGSKSSSIACVLVLLYRVSHGTSSRVREKPLSLTTLDLLTGNELLNALLDYVERCKRPLGRAGRILLKVLR